MRLDSIIDENLTIHINRGDQLELTLIDNDNPFIAGDKFKFSIMKANDSTTVLLQKEYTVESNTNSFDIIVPSEEMRLGDPIKTGTKTYWYEIEHNGIYTVIGYDQQGPKQLIMYPEAASKEDN